jgi:putative intracellular protease/amidase
MQIAIPIFDGFTAIDVVGPYEVLARVPGAEIVFPAPTTGPIRADNPPLAMLAETTLAEVRSPDVLVVPGGWGTRQLLRDERWLAWIAAAHATSTITASVCTGSLLLAAAGVLTGLDATTHWLQLESLQRLGATPRRERVVRSGKVFTSGGATAGIDLALVLAAELAGAEVAKAIQLAIEYDPQPPFDCGSPEKAPPQLVEHLRSAAAARNSEAGAASAALST